MASTWGLIAAIVAIFAVGYTVGKAFEAKNYNNILNEKLINNKSIIEERDKTIYELRSENMTLKEKVIYLNTNNENERTKSAEAKHK